MRLVPFVRCRWSSVSTMTAREQPCQAVIESADGLMRAVRLREDHVMLSPQSIQASPVPPTGCCPPFDPRPWQDREIAWHSKPFVKDHVRCLFHVPLNMGRTVMKDMALIDGAHAAVDRPLMLSDEKSPWGADLYIEVKGRVPQASMAYLSGTFLTRVFEGPFLNAGGWAQDMKNFVTARGRTLERLYFGYTTCPKCAKAYGKNYVVMFAQVSDRPSGSTP